MNYVTNKKYLVFIALVAIVTLGINNSAFASTTSPIKLFSTGIGTSTSESGPNIGIYADEQTLLKYDKFYFPPSFAVDNDSNTVFVLDSIRNRVAIFSIVGQYMGEINLPFNLSPIDFAYFPKTETMIFIFQNSPDIGVLNVDPANGFSIKSSSAFVVSQASSTQKTAGGFLNIWPINTLNTADNYFVLSPLDSSPSLVFVQASSSISEASKIGKDMNGAVGSQSQTAIVGYGGGSTTELLVQDVKTGQVNPVTISTSTNGIDASANGNSLALLQLAGTDENGDFYIKATYPSNIIEASGTLIVYKLDQIGSVVDKTEVFSSPKMLTNRYLFIDPYGSVYYMRADNQNTISFYEYQMTGNSMSVVSGTTISANMGVLSLLCPYISYTGNTFWILAGILTIILVVIGIIGATISHALISKHGGKIAFGELLVAMLFAVLVCPALIVWDIYSAPCHQTLSAFATSNLLMNPGAETGNLSGWTTGGVSNPPVDNGTKDPGINPHGGKYDFWGGNGILGTLSQTVNLVGNQGITATMIDNRNLFASTLFWEQGLDQGKPSDDGSFSLAFLNASKNVISTTSSPVIDSHDGTWKNYADQYAIPAGTRFITYTMNFLRNVGDNLDTFIDDNSLIVTNLKHQTK